MNTLQLPQRLARAAGSLKLRVALVGGLLIALSVAVTVWWVLRDIGRYTQRIALEGQQVQAQRMAQTISMRLVGLQLSLRGAAKLLPVDLVGEPAAMGQFLAASPVLTEQFNNNAVIDSQGRLVALFDAGTVKLPDQDIADRAYVQRTMQEMRPIISEPTRSQVSGQPIVVLTMPVAGRDGKVAAILAGSLRLSARGALEDVVSAYEDDHAVTAVVDAKGKILAHPQSEWVHRDAADEPRLAAAIAHWAAQGRPIEPAGDAVDTGAHIVALAGVPDADWVVLRSVPEAVLLGGLARGRERAVQVGVLVALLGAASLLLATLVALAPLRRLERRAQRLRDPALADDDGWPREGGEIGRLSAVFREVMRERRLGDQARSDLLGRMQAVMAHAPVGICFTRDKRFELVSTRFNQLLGYDDPGLQGQSPRVIYASHEFHAALDARVAETFAAGAVFDEEIEFVRRDGGRFWGRLQGTPVSADDDSAGTIWIVDDVTRARREREALAWNSSHDALTALVNRAEFERRLRSQIDNRRRFPASALFIDLDHFKAINDSAGHAAGDRALTDVAQLLLEQVRDDDTVARLGGDEFAVLLQGCERDNAARVAEKMRAAVESYRLSWQGRTLTLGASFGVVELDTSLPTLAAVMAAADAACYQAKRDGRNAIRVHRAAACAQPALSDA